MKGMRDLAPFKYFLFSSYLLVVYFSRFFWNTSQKETVCIICCVTCSWQLCYCQHSYLLLRSVYRPSHLIELILWSVTRYVAAAAAVAVWCHWCCCCCRCCWYITYSPLCACCYCCCCCCLKSSKRCSCFFLVARNYNIMLLLFSFSFDIPYISYIYVIWFFFKFFSLLQLLCFIYFRFLFFILAILKAPY